MEELKNSKLLYDKISEVLIDKGIIKPSKKNVYEALCDVLNNNLNIAAALTEEKILKNKRKHAYYLSMEFLFGKILEKILIYFDIKKQTKQAIEKFGFAVDEIYEEENEMALGNGGLGRLASCFFDSLATHSYPAFGYSLFHKYGLFKQIIENGEQKEIPENWALENTVPWITEKKFINYEVSFGGTLQDGKWIPEESVKAIAYDMNIPGYKTTSVLNLRLWKAKPIFKDEVNLEEFKKGNIPTAFEKRHLAEKLTAFLYPPTESTPGRELRLKQEYFFASASIQDILQRAAHAKIKPEQLSKFINIHLNDTHPVIGIPEFIRLLIEKYNMSYTKAYKITNEVFCFTNHTLVADGMERWSIPLMQQVLPYHFEIIKKINHDYMKKVSKVTDIKENPQVTIIDKASVKMANLAIVGSKKVNGVARLHSALLQDKVFPELKALYKNKFLNVTNGITQRRWMLKANPLLSNLITSKIGDKWITDLDELKKLEKYKNDEEFLTSLADVKKENKKRLKDFIKNETGEIVNINHIFDTQIKRIHEYKRQLLNVLKIVDIYNKIKQNKIKITQPRTYIFAGKAAMTYDTAKLILNLINDIASVINNDKKVNKYLKVVFIPDYSVSKAEIIISGTEVSEQLSQAGWEASGTGNMKFALNGALTIGTLDGANIEIKSLVGADNIFIFGHNSDEISKIKKQGYKPKKIYKENSGLKEVVDMIKKGHFSKYDKNKYKDLMKNLIKHDSYMLFADFSSYLEVEKKVEKVYSNTLEWNKKSLINIANTGYFSSDRAIKEYVNKIWKLKPLS